MAVCGSGRVDRPIQPVWIAEPVGPDFLPRAVDRRLARLFLHDVLRRRQQGFHRAVELAAGVIGAAFLDGALAGCKAILGSLDQEIGVAAANARLFERVRTA